MKKIKIFAGVVVLISIVYVIFLRLDFSSSKPQIYGVHFTKSYAEFLGLDWKKTYLALLDDLKVDHVRLGAYWNEMELQQGQYDFSSLDWMMDQAAKRNVKVLLAVGQRLPRWPECHIPAWARALTPQDQQQVLVNWIDQVVRRYRTYENLEWWQVENEPFLTVFGECAPMSGVMLAQEVAVVKNIDPRRSVMVTTSGELSPWKSIASYGDVLGITLYRTVWNANTGYFSYDWIFPPALYRLKAWWTGKSTDRVVVAELQAEPWVPNGSVITTPLQEQYRSMNVERINQTIAFAKRTGFPRVYLWGGEWWYWLKQQGDDSMWKTIGLLLSKK